MPAMAIPLLLTRSVRARASPMPPKMTARMPRMMPGKASQQVARAKMPSTSEVMANPLRAGRRPCGSP
jgi:hypothetical protein